MNYSTRYQKEHYDRIQVLLPKGEKELLKDAADSSGMSMSQYISFLIRKEREGILDSMQIYDVHRKKIKSIVGSSKDGYTVKLMPGFKHKGNDYFICRTKSEIRKTIKEVDVHHDVHHV